MYSIVSTVHIVLFVLVLILGINVIARALRGRSTNALFTDADRKAGLFFMISLHIQLLIGLALYFFFSPITQLAFADFGAAMKDSGTRLIAVEHISVNIIAVVLATVNNAKNKKAIADAAKHKNALIFTIAALVLILSRIPWKLLF
ncbi:hypothetical protein [Aquirufa sp.]|jgi:hypothetical protein|uniref:hypothetical protein n=1 Tax=Aquirufa sp. TaxID=2676249 RepID=UPI0037C0E128